MPVSLCDDDNDYDDGDWAASDVVFLIRGFYSVSLKTVQVTDTFDGYDMDKVMPTTRDNNVGGGGEEGEGGSRRCCGPPIAGRQREG
jgi:hypothetical protein